MKKCRIIYPIGHSRETAGPYVAPGKGDIVVRNRGRNDAFHPTKLRRSETNCCPHPDGVYGYGWRKCPVVASDYAALTTGYKRVSRLRRVDLPVRRGTR